MLLFIFLPKPFEAMGGPQSCPVSHMRRHRRAAVLVHSASIVLSDAECYVA